MKIADKSITFSEIEEDFMNYEKNILVYLNEYLYTINKGEIFDFPDNVNIEHIMPSSGGNIETIRIDAGIESKEEFKRLVNLLGNKILLEEDINKSIGNDWFKNDILKATEKAADRILDFIFQ